MKVTLHISDTTRIPELGLLTCVKLVKCIERALQCTEDLHGLNALSLGVSDAHDEIADILIHSGKPCFVMRAKLQGEGSQRFVFAFYFEPENTPYITCITTAGVNSYSTPSIDDLLECVTDAAVQALTRAT